MLRKNLLLAGAAAGLALVASGASAHTLTLRAAANAPAGSINAANANVATGGYRLAEEINFANLAPGTLALTDTLGSGSLPSGNVILTVSLTNSTFSGAVNAALVTGSGANCGTFTASLSSGGQAGGNTATFVISNSTAGCAAYDLTLPVRIAGQGSATVSTDLRTEAGNPIDPPNPATLTYLTTRNAFFLTVNAANGAVGGALGVSQGQLSQLPANTAPYTIFRTGGQFHVNAPESATAAQLGTVQLTADATSFRDLQGTPVAAGDVTAAQYTVTGNLTPYTNTTLGGANINNAPGAQSAVFSSANGGLATVNTTQAVGVNGIRSPIVVSPYSVSVTFALAAPTYLAQAAESGNLETITREGTNVILPWMNSVSIRASGGTTNIARIGNIGGAATGAVYAQVLSSVSAAGGYANQGVRQLVGTIPAAGELVITTDTLTAAVGDFGRGDVLISIEALPNTVTVRRFLQRPGEGLTELQSGSVGLDQLGVAP